MKRCKRKRFTSWFIRVVVILVVPRERTNMKRLMVCICTSLLMLASVTGVMSATRYENPKSTRASEVLPAESLIGPHYRIQDTVVSYGYMYHFTVDSDFGTFEATGEAALRKLLREIHAIAALRKLKKGKEFAKSVGDAALSPVYFSQELITHPVDTVTGIPKGIFRLFSNVGTAATTKRDPNTDSRLKTVLLVSTNKRDYAAKLGVDVYSTNRVLQKELNSVGWAAAIGSLGVTVAAAPFSGPGMLAFKTVRFSRNLNNILQQEPPSRLRQINAKKLTEMEVPDELQKKFLDHPSLSPRHKTVIAHALAELTNARGRAAFIALALSAEDEVDANFFMQMAETMRGYHTTVAPVTDITTRSPLVLANSANGAILLPFPLDHGVWTKLADRVLTEIVTTAKTPGSKATFELWVTGTVSPLARQQLAQRGIKVVENVDQRLTFMD